MAIQAGDLVTFRRGLYADEDGVAYRVLEINGDRCVLILANTSLPIPPQSVAMLADLEKFNRVNATETYN